MTRLLFSLIAFLLTASFALGADQQLPTFGSNLFQGNFASSGASSTLQPGDRILVRLWGARTLETTCTVTPEGDLDLPDVGKVSLSGLPRDDASQIQKAIESKLLVEGIADAQVYARPLDAQKISVFVTGFVNRPGSYAGMSSDNILAFLDRAGGIDPRRGSYRSISVMRGGRNIASADLYPFILRGQIPAARFRDGDTIVVAEQRPTVSATGEVRNAARFEFDGEDPRGSSLASLADPSPQATHVSVTGYRHGTPFSQYVSLEDFSRMRLENGDSAVFHADSKGRAITIEAQGAIAGPSRFPVMRGAHLKDVLNYISVVPERANLQGIYIRRISTAKQQKKAINDALNRLEQNAYTATSSSSDEAQIRAKEAEMLSSFIQRARSVEPEGIVVVGSGGETADIAMEDGDIIVIPEKSDVVMISGEVIMPQAVVWSKDRSLDDYIRSAGGFSNRADRSNLIAVHPNGEVVPRPREIQPGDQILVLPHVDTKNMQALKEISQILYQVAVAAKVILAL